MKPMRELEIGHCALQLDTGKEVRAHYAIVVAETTGRVACESYGVKIWLEGGESVRVDDITLDTNRIETLANLLHRHSVTPCTLRDVLDDWL